MEAAWPDFPQDGDTDAASQAEQISLCTINLYQGYGKEITNRVLPTLNQHKPEPSLVVSQEAPKLYHRRHPTFGTVTDLSKSMYKGRSRVMASRRGSENLGIWLRDTGNAADWVFTGEEEKFDDLHCRMCSEAYRFAQVFTVASRNGNSKLKIANVHLCGGRFDDQTWQPEDTTRKDFMVDLLTKHDPDIVLGDFNAMDAKVSTVVVEKAAAEAALNARKSSSKLFRLFGKQPAYERRLQNFYEWRQQPFQVLREAKYLPVSMKTVKTTYYGAGADMIWYKVGKLESKSTAYSPETAPDGTRVMPLFHACEKQDSFITDHLPVCATLQVVAGPEETTE